MEGVTVKKLPKSQMLFEVALPEGAVSAEMPRAAEALSHKLDIKGFRKGKVPQDILEKQVGKARLFEEAGYIAIEKTYKAIFKEHDLNPAGSSKVQIKKRPSSSPRRSKKPWRISKNRAGRKFSSCVLRKKAIWRSLILRCASRGSSSTAETRATIR